MTTGHEHRYALPPGHRLGDYRIDRYLGSGGFGITYLARDRRLGIQVAIKEYLPSNVAVRGADQAVVAKTAEDEDDFEWGRKRFLDEARSLSPFRHPNIVRVLRFFEANGTSCMVMDYLEGRPLSELLKRRGTLTEAEIHRLALPLCEGLAEVHRAGLLHRDIKPANIVIRADGAPVLIDFGAARLATGIRSRTLTSVVTPRYAPPEQYGTKSRQEPATDIYALGAMLYRCVTGRAPDDATDRLINDEQVPAAQAAADGYSKGLLAAIDAALALRMEDRPNSVPAFLSQLLGQESAEQKGLADPATKRPRPAAGGGEAGPSHGTGGAANRQSERESKTSKGPTKPKTAEQEPLQELAEAMGLHDFGLYELALPKFQRLAEQGYVRAQFTLAKMFAEGLGTPPDPARARKWFRKAADQGHARAQVELGLLEL